MLSRLELRSFPDAARPELTAEHLEEMLEALETPARIIVLRGTPELFSPGLSLEMAARQPQGALQCAKAMANLLIALLAAPAPVIAVVDGKAMGGGVGLACAADLVLATPHATFALPEVISGLFPAVIFPVVAQRMGIARARLLALSAESLNAQQAMAAGLVDEVTEDPEARIQHWEKRWRRMDPRAMAALKRWSADVAGTEAHLQEGVHRLGQQLALASTQQRLERMMNGESPWDEEDA